MDVAEIAGSGGVIRIADKVLATIARRACLSVPGVASMNSRYNHAIPSMIAGDDAEGVRISIRDNQVEVDLYILAVHGLRVPEVALHVQEKVRDTLSSMTGLHVSSVNVSVEGMIFGQEGRYNHG